MLATRARNDGFWIALSHGGATPSDVELWQIALDGQASLVGGYPGAPRGFAAGHAGTSSSACLDGDGRLYQFGEGSNELFHDVIIVRAVGGSSEVAYDEWLSPIVRVHMSRLVTGP